MWIVQIIWILRHYHLFLFKAVWLTLFLCIFFNNVYINMTFCYYYYVLLVGDFLFVISLRFIFCFITFILPFKFAFLVWFVLIDFIILLFHPTLPAWSVLFKNSCYWHLNIVDKEIYKLLSNKFTSSVRHMTLCPFYRPK